MSDKELQQAFVAHIEQTDRFAGLFEQFVESELQLEVAPDAAHYDSWRQAVLSDLLDNIRVYREDVRELKELVIDA